MFRRLFLIFILLAGAGCSQAPQAANNESPAAGPVQYVIKGVLKDCQNDSIKLYDFVGYDFKPIGGAKIERNGTEGTFTLSGTAPSRGVYFLATTLQAQQQIGHAVVLGEDAEVRFSASVNNFAATMQFEKSPANEAYLRFQRRTAELQGQINQNNQYLSVMMQRDPAAAETYRKRGDSLFSVQAAYHEAEGKKTGVTAKAAKIYYFLPYNANAANAAKYKTEQDYIAAQFFAGVDFKDPELGYLPIFYEKTLVYVQTLVLSFDITGDELVKRLKAIQTQLPPKSKAEEIFLLGCIVGGEKAQNELAGLESLLYGVDEYVKNFPDRPRNSLLNQIAAQTRARVEKEKITAIGSVPPEIALPSPDGKEIKLSSLRGKVVLIDFWASWCGPCRRENPNVVRAYNQYKSKGFEIFSVSLDRAKDAWVAAIEKDGLVWPSHVSDLKQWQSVAAAAYGVNSIPATFLLDKNGKIVAKNLRGPALEEKLKELLD